MITIKKNRTQEIFATLKENSIYDPSYYLLKLVSNDNLQEKVVYLGLDSSLNPIRYSELVLTEAATDDLLLGQINLTEGMTYDYTFYESPTPDSITIGSFERIVETGTLKVVSTTTSISTYTDKNTIITYGN